MGQRLSVLTPGAAGAAFARRVEPSRGIAEDADRVSRACYDMALRFSAGGKLIVFGTGGASTDAQHVAVEFVHPVIVGKRALPALSLTNDVATVTGLAAHEGLGEVFAHQLHYLADPGDIALGISADGHGAHVLRGFEVARELGLLTIALTGGDGGEIAASDTVDHVLVAHSDEAAVVKEVHVTTYHILWELVHVFFERPGVLAPELVR